MRAFKIMKVSDQDNSWKTLFHGVDGDRNIQCDRWIWASNEWVRDGSGGTYYESGWHVLPSYAGAMKYMENFSDPTDKYIVECEVKSYRKKTHARSEVFLADTIKLGKEAVPC
tara:strand:- start:8300 stop:8638 length:339 start_codon:yes stop_codon:yes gene_type:complete